MTGGWVAIAGADPEVDVPDAKPFYITTPIYYVNGRPHIGHAYTSIVADSLARFQRARGRGAYLLTGTDEHGQKVLEKAVSRGMGPQEHVDDMVVHWRAMMDRLNISYDHFVRTTDADHVRCVQSVLQSLHDKGLFYSDAYVGWYSPAAERFWTEKDLVEGKCPDTGLPVERVEETNWFFKMGAYQQRLIDHIEAHPEFIQPSSRRNEVLGFLRKELGDLCISRPAERMSWGIPFPFDERYVTYVWFDALLNYVSHAGFDPNGSTERFAELWPADVQLLGKDILTTHAVYWSTMLMALELPLPRTLFAHGWWMSADGSKMSKSLGNAIDVDLLVDAYGVDALRFFLLREVAFGADGQFSYESFQNRYNADLANDLGNLAHRGVSMSTKWLGGSLPTLGAGTGHEAALRELAAGVPGAYAAAMDELRPHDALEAVFSLVRAGNKYIDDTKPWALNKAGDTEALSTVLRHVLEVSTLAAALLEPVMPTKMAELLGTLGAGSDRGAALLRSALAGQGVLQQLEAGTALTLGDPLFPRFREFPPAIAALFAVEAEPPAPSKKKSKKKKGPPEPPAEIPLADFAKVALRAGRVVSAEAHPNATKLLVLGVDVGEAEPRQIVAGIATKYAPAELIGKRVVVVANLAPIELRGVMSQGMLLAAGGKEVVDMVTVDAKPGEIVR